MYHTNSQSFKQCRTSVIIVIAKCTFNVTLGKRCCNLISLREVCCSFVLSDQCCFISYYKCVIILNFYHCSLCSHWSYTWKNLENFLIEQPHITHPSWMTQCTVLVLKPQPYLLVLHNAHFLPSRNAHCAISMLNPDPWAPKLCSPCLQSVSSANYAVSSRKNHPWPLKLWNYSIPWPLSLYNYAVGMLNLQALSLTS